MPLSLSLYGKLHKERRDSFSKVFEEFLGDDASARVDGQLHLADLFVDFLHEMDDEVHQLVLVHLLRVEVGDEEADVIALHRFPSQDEEVLGSHHHEAHELVAQDLLDLVRLFDGDADPHRVDGALDQDFLLIVAADHHRLQKQLFAAPDLHLRLVVPFHHLRGEVLQTQGCLQGGTHGVQVRTQGRRLEKRNILQTGFRLIVMSVTCTTTC